MTGARRTRLTVEDHVQGVLAGDRAVLGRTITLVESNHPRHREMADEVLRQLLPHTGRAKRVGLSGVPGAGKSTLIERLGLMLLDRGHRLAVLAVDPSSGVSGGSILGDKTRMSGLAARREAFIRPSPTSGNLGGVHRKTRETMWVCEAAGYDVVIVETVGVGQAEYVVSSMVDTFVVLMLAGAGDELQGIKKGILEMVDVLAINKADGEGKLHADRARREYASALHMVRSATPDWTVPVHTCSGLRGTGLEALWQSVLDHDGCLRAQGLLSSRRSTQRLKWMWEAVEQSVLERLRSASEVTAIAPELERQVLEGEITPGRAAAEIVGTWLGGRGEST